LGAKRAGPADERRLRLTTLGRDPLELGTVAMLVCGAQRVAEVEQLVDGLGLVAGQLVDQPRALVRPTQRGHSLGQRRPARFPSPSDVFVARCNELVGLHGVQLDGDIGEVTLVVGRRAHHNHPAEEISWAPGPRDLVERDTGRHSRIERFNLARNRNPSNQIARLPRDARQPGSLATDHDTQRRRSGIELTHLDVTVAG
jgi:hypothetical protein